MKTMTSKQPLVVLVRHGLSRLPVLLLLVVVEVT